jgi:hypothetical protein
LYWRYVFIAIFNFFNFKSLKLFDHLGALYLTIWQHYVLRIEFIINIILLVFLALESVLSLIAIILFARSGV